MFYREVINDLIEWKNDDNKVAFRITGARQIGKTTLVREFGKKHYEQLVEINFILDKRARDIFKDLPDVDTIITNITAYCKKKLIPHKTLILLDEIQECPEARTAIKSLVLDGRFDYIETGSLLGVNQQNISSFPVGFEKEIRMYPMSFKEFILANGMPESVIEDLKRCYEERKAPSQSVHDTMMKLFYTYIVVGGMPQVVNTYVNTHDIARVIKNQRDILKLYEADITKYASSDVNPKIKAILRSVPNQLNDKNRRFMLADIDEQGRYRRYNDSFMWLADAGVTLPCYNVEEPVLPLKLNEKMNLFKLYMADTGLLCAASMDNIQLSLLQGDLSVNMGAILENIIAQELVCNGFDIHYFNSKKHGELDFVLQNGQKIELLEIKSGNDYKRHQAFSHAKEIWHFNSDIVFCKGNVEVSDTTYLPLYMIMFYKHVAPPKSLIHKVDISFV